MSNQPKVAGARPAGTYSIAAALRASLARLRHDRSSTVAVEFAMIGTVLFTFLFAIFFLGIAQFWQMTLDDSVRNATRQLQIKPGMSSTEFVANVCSEFGVAVPNCSTALQYAVQTPGAATPYFRNLTPVAIGANGFAGGGAQFPAPGALNNSAPVLVQVAYKFPMAVPFLPVSLITLNGTPYLLSAASAIEEP
jgi:Flp pilus assembly protein TadG